MDRERARKNLSNGLMTAALVAGIFALMFIFSTLYIAS